MQAEASTLRIGRCQIEREQRVLREGERAARRCVRLVSRIVDRDNHVVGVVATVKKEADKRTKLIARSDGLCGRGIDRAQIPDGRGEGGGSNRGTSGLSNETASRDFHDGELFFDDELWRRDQQVNGSLCALQRTGGRDL